MSELETIVCQDAAAWDAWLAVNVAKVAALTAAGRMQPSGQAEVAAAKADGRWDRAS